MDNSARHESQTSIVVHDKYLLSMWDSNSQRICGKRVALGLFSVESFNSNKRDEHQVARLLAEKVVPTLRDIIQNNEKTLRANLKEVSDELEQVRNDPLYKSISLAEAPTSEYRIVVDQKGAWPLVNLFIRSFVLIDMITSELKALHQLGSIDFSTYKKREKKYAKPMWQAMTQIEDLVKAYHQKRKAISQIATNGGKHDQAANR